MRYLSPPPSFLPVPCPVARYPHSISNSIALFVARVVILINVIINIIIIVVVVDDALIVSLDSVDRGHVLMRTEYGPMIHTESRIAPRPDIAGRQFSA